MVVILLSGVFAGEKIGVPFIPLGEGNVDSMVISKNGDIYTIILYSVYEIQLWDIERKKLLKKIKTSLDLGTMSKYGLLVLSQGSKNILNYITIVIFL
ncbi:hypothetical protein MNB_SM-4-1090 [hydrothermal vent metagenome]|uniref:Uncharacterized protein n=1 Tax=hydrothermal vent metagenome TaxID=652676 RepID=A0A1W1CT19_9ZZZZ